MSKLKLFPIFILTLGILFGCISQSVDGRPQETKNTQTGSVQNATKPLESSKTDLTKDVITGNTTETSNKTSTTTKPPKLSTDSTTKAPLSTSARTTVKTTIHSTTKITTTTTKPKTTQGTTKPTESPKLPVPLTKVPLKAERPESKSPSKDVIVNKTETQGAHNENVKSFLPDRQPDLGGIADPLDGDEEEENPTFRLKEPGFGTPKPRPPVTTPASTDEDKRIRKMWGGNCLAEHWRRCSNIKTWADFYVVYEKSDKDKLNPIKRNRKYDCWGKDENTYCLRNGWTVNRCHINCMANCNRDMFQKWEEFVSHDGACPLWK